MVEVLVTIMFLFFKIILRMCFVFTFLLLLSFLISPSVILSCVSSDFRSPGLTACSSKSIMANDFQLLVSVVVSNGSCNVSCLFFFPQRSMLGLVEKSLLQMGSNVISVAVNFRLRLASRANLPLPPAPRKCSTVGVIAHYTG